MRHFKSALLGLVLAFTLLMTASAMATDTREEIDHLLSFIAASPCTFIRNGVAYDGARAVDHIKDKYEHYREDVHSAEDFIALAASRSTLSGRPYLVTCGGVTEPAADWIARELGAFRQRAGS
jgi:hypothetical protein